MEAYGRKFVKAWFGTKKERRNTGGMYGLPPRQNNRYHKRPARLEGRLEAEHQNEARYNPVEDYDFDDDFDIIDWDYELPLRVPGFPTIGDLLASSS